MIKFEISIGDLVASLAFLLGILNFIILLIDRRPKVKINTLVDSIIHHDEEGGGSEEELLWIDLVNRSSRKIRIANLWIEWKRGRFNQKKREIAPNFQSSDSEAKEGQFLFWIEPWGSVSFVQHLENIQDWMLERNKSSEVWFRIAANDVLGHWHYSKYFRLKLPT